LLAVFYEVIKETRKVRKEYLTKEEKMVPPDLIKVFLREYFETFLELARAIGLKPDNS
jgi:hypothetical protein